MVSSGLFLTANFQIISQIVVFELLFYLQIDVRLDLMYNVCILYIKGERKLCITLEITVGISRKP